LDDPPVSWSPREEDAELAAGVDDAAPGVLRRAAATAARYAVRLTQLEHDPVVAEALAAAETGQPHHVDDHSPLGWRTRTWAVEARIAGRMRNDSSASLWAQQAHANLLRASGRAPVAPLIDPSPWLEPQRVRARWLRLAAAQAVRAALFADPRGAVSATLGQLRHLPDDAWTAVRAATLAVLQPGSTAGLPDATEH
jgi:hypothetical protein